MPMDSNKNCRKKKSYTICERVRCTQGNHLLTFLLPPISRATQIILTRFSTISKQKYNVYPVQDNNILTISFFPYIYLQFHDSDQNESFRSRTIEVQSPVPLRTLDIALLHVNLHTLQQSERKKTPLSASINISLSKFRWGKIFYQNFFFSSACARLST